MVTLLFQGFRQIGATYVVCTALYSGETVFIALWDGSTGKGSYRCEEKSLSHDDGYRRLCRDCLGRDRHHQRYGQWLRQRLGQWFGYW